MDLQRTVYSPESINFQTEFKRYIQSYINWLYQQNEKAFEVLTSDEIFEYFIHSIEHPLWFQLFLKKYPFRGIAEIHNYLIKYGNQANMMRNDVAIYPLNNQIGLKPVVPRLTLQKAEGVELLWGQKIMRSENLKMPHVISTLDIQILKHMMN